MQSAANLKLHLPSGQCKGVTIIPSVFSFDMEPIQLLRTAKVTR